MLALRRGLLNILSVGYANTLSLGYFKSTTLFLYILESTKQLSSDTTVDLYKTH